MAQAPRDQNKVPTLLATSNADGSTVKPVVGEPDNHTLGVNLGDSGSDLSDAPVDRDQNRVTAIMAVSADDGVTPVPVYLNDSTGELLIQST